MQRGSTLLKLGRVDEAEKDFTELVSEIKVEIRAASSEYE